MTSKRFIVWSVLLHVIVVAVLVFSVDFGSQKIATPITQKSDIVQAKIIDSKAVEKEVKRLQAEDEKARLEKERKAQDAERKVREAEQKRKREEQRVKELETKQELLKQQTEKESKHLAEAKRVAEQARKQAEQKKIHEQRQVAEKKKAEEAAKVAEKQKAEEQAKAEQARKEAERKRVEQALQTQLEAEEAAAAQSSADADELSKFVAAISNSVRQSFTIQPGLEGLSCTLRITFIPGGEVAGVEVIKSSGNPLFDRQAENAVRKAAPLPVPSDPRLFQKMRSIAFVFRL